MQVLLLQDLQGFTPIQQIQPVSIENLLFAPTFDSQTEPSEDFLNLQELDQEIELENLSDKGAKWYTIDPTKVFKSEGKKDVRATDGGACDGAWFDQKFLKAPYIKMDSSSITATITKDVKHKKACIHNGTIHKCPFFLGNNGV